MDTGSEMAEMCMFPVRQLATDHVEWFLRTLRPLLIDHMEHGYKHGLDDGKKLKPLKFATRETLAVAECGFGGTKT